MNKRSKLQGHNMAMAWCNGKHPISIYEKYMRCLALQIECAEDESKFLNAYVEGIERYMMHSIRTRKHKASEFVILKSF